MLHVRWRTLSIGLVLFAFGLPAAAQENGLKPLNGGDTTSPAPGSFKDKELGITFPGIYGWKFTAAPAGGAWTELARYSEESYGALVLLEVRPNVYSSYDAFAKAQKEEFAEGGDSSKGMPVYQGVSIQKVEMSGGAGLLGLQVRALETTTVKGKSRDSQILVRTYFAKDRLFRVRCSAPTGRYRRVEDLFTQALTGLNVEKGKATKVTLGTPFKSQRGGYECTIPEGFSVILPPASEKDDVRIEARSKGLVITVRSQAFQGESADLLDKVLDEFGRDFNVEKEDADILGGRGFSGTVSRGSGRIAIVGTVRNGRAVQIRISFVKEAEASARSTLASFLESFHILG